MFSAAEARHWLSVLYGDEVSKGKTVFKANSEESPDLTFAVTLSKGLVEIDGRLGSWVGRLMTSMAKSKNVNIKTNSNVIFEQQQNQPGENSERLETKEDERGSREKLLISQGLKELSGFCDPDIFASAFSEWPAKVSSN